MVSSVTSTSRTKGCRASCFRSKMFVRSASRSMVSPATAARPISPRSQPRARIVAIARSYVSSSGAVPGAGVAVEPIEPSPRRPGGVDHRVDETFVAPEAVHADDVSIARRDLDGLLEVLEGEGGRVPESVLGLGSPFRDPLVGQVALDAGRGVPVAAL